MCVSCFQNFKKFISCNKKAGFRMSVLRESNDVQVIKILFKKKVIICLQMMCSCNLAQTHVRDIGL